MNNLLRRLLHTIRYTFGWSRLNIRRKMIVAYLALVLIPSCLFMYFYYERSSTILQEEVNQSILQTLKQAEINISDKLNSVETVANQITSNAKIYLHLGREGNYLEPKQQILDYKEISRELEYIHSNTSVYNIRMYVNPTLMYSREKSQFFSLQEIEGSDFYNQVRKLDGAILWTTSYLRTNLLGDQKYVLSAAKMLRHLDDYDRLLSVLILDVEEDILSEIISSIQLDKGEQVALIDENGMILSHKNKDLIGNNYVDERQLDKSSFNQNEGSFRIHDNNHSSVLLYQSIPLTGWKLVAEVPANQLITRNDTFNRIAIAIFIGTTAIAFTLIIVLLLGTIAENNNRRISKIVRTLQRVGLDGMDHKNISSNNESLQGLEQSIDHVIVTVKSLMEESFSAKLHEREALLRALQAQINPHFLYNTLDTINWMSIRQGADDISNVVGALSKYFRYSLNKGRDIVTLEDELQLVKAYAEIQQKRFPDQFNLNIHADKEASSCYLPKLTLQPLVENALIHGLYETRAAGAISITARITSEDLYITVEDNGVGMTQETIDKLLLSPEQTKELSSSGYGVYNVHERIRLYGGENSGLTLKSTPGLGTSISIRIARIPGREGNL